LWSPPIARREVTVPHRVQGVCNESKQADYGASLRGRPRALLAQLLSTIAPNRAGRGWTLLIYFGGRKCL